MNEKELMLYIDGYMEAKQVVRFQLQGILTLYSGGGSLKRAIEGYINELNEEMEAYCASFPDEDDAQTELPFPTSGAQ